MHLTASAAAVRLLQPVRRARHDSRRNLHHGARECRQLCAAGAQRIVAVTLFVRAHLLDDRSRASVRLRQAMQMSFEMLDHLSLQAWVNDALMTVFFLLVGVEIKRELVHGELRDVRAVALPVAAAFGGMVVPAAIYRLFNAGGVGADGWAIPMATDIAFAVGVVTLLFGEFFSKFLLFAVQLPF